MARRSGCCPSTGRRSPASSARIRSRSIRTSGVLADGFLMLSSSRVRGEFVLRFCVVNHRTTDDDVLRSVARIRELID
jgi:hypothetical protein